jgi:threonine/homoserine/homoserine lactone efflux protein
MSASYLSIAALLFAAFITPGPNNLLVISFAQHQTKVQAGLNITAIALGSGLLLFLCSNGAAAITDKYPNLFTIFSLMGCLYLIWIGTKLFFKSAEDPATSSSEMSLSALFLFQFMNPKSVGLMMSIANAHIWQFSESIFLAVLAIVMSIICLSVWFIIGTSFRKHFLIPATETLLNRVMGGLLILSALTLLGVT